MPRPYDWRKILCLPSLLLIALAGCDRNSSAANKSFSMPPPAVTVTTVTVADVPQYLDEIGKTTAFQVVAIQPQVSGKVTEIHFQDGADLKKGQPLFTIDPRPYKAALDQAKAQLAQAKAQLELAKIEFNRVKDLPRSVEPQEDYDEKSNAIDVAAAAVAANTASVETAQINVQFCSIDSPIDGRAGQRLVDLGNIVNSNMVGMTSALTAGANGGSTLLTIQELDPIYADFTIDEGQLSEVRARMAGGTLRTMVRVPEDKDWHTGSLTFLDNSVQDGSGTIKLRATLENKDHHFWPGQFVNVRLLLQEFKDAVLIPSQCVQVGQQGLYVYTVHTSADGTPPKAALQPVVPGQTHGDMTVIMHGLKPGDTVVTTGQMTVIPDLPVTVVPSGPSGPPSPATAPASANASPSTQPVDQGVAGARP